MTNKTFTIKGQIIDLFNQTIFSGEIIVENGHISQINKIDNAPNHFILPGLVDSHVHIESSMLIPSRFAKMVVPRGTIAVVSDPHEIANVMGEEGIQFMIDDGKTVPLKFFFGAPSCVPATLFESSGAVLNAEATEKLLDNPDIYFLSEMMNYPCVVYDDKDVIAKIDAARKRNMRIDGHAPALSGEDLKKYVSSGISTDHECSSLNEAKAKIALGMKIQIREGSAARNFKALAPLFKTNPESVMLCTDDSHPDEIETSGHIDRLIKLGQKNGINIFDLLRSATIIPVQHYNLPVGLLRVNDPADFIVIDSLENFNVLESYINGELVYNNQGIKFTVPEVNPVNNFRSNIISHEDIIVTLPENKKSVKVIEINDGELVTSKLLWKPNICENRIINPDISNDILKIVVVNRYKNVPPSVGFVRNMGIKQGALASSVAHDSHNLIAIGVDDKSICDALNLLIQHQGGICAIDNNSSLLLELPVAGLMSTQDGKNVSRKYQSLNDKIHKMGSKLKAPFMALSFLSLLVIPHLKLGDKGLFDVDKFSFTSLFE